MVSVYLAVMALLLGYLAERQKKLRAERDIAAKLLSLVRVDIGLAGVLGLIVRELLRIYGAEGALIAARESGGRRVIIGQLKANSTMLEIEWQDPGPDGLEIYLPEHVANAYYARAGNGKPMSEIRGLDEPGGMLEFVAPTAIRRFAALHEFQTLASASFSISPELSGRIFLIDPDFTSGVKEELRFLQELVWQVAPAVYNVYLLRRLRKRAGAAERARLVRELHDGAVQSLIGVEMQVDVLRRSSLSGLVTRELERIQGLLREEVLKLRELMQEMKSTEVDARKLPGFLRDTVQRFQRETGISAHFTMDGDEVVLTQSVCRELARIAQEALVNVRKHSCAKQVTVQLVQEDGGWQLAIEDDGTGFPFSGRIAHAEMEGTGRGPAIIRERVRLIQGDLTIESNPGKGARIEVFVPEMQPAEVGIEAYKVFRS
jgi:signal transduction histidine kinase